MARVSRQPGYRERERKYLDAEARYTKVDSLDTGGKNLAFDTTGSVIHLDEVTVQWLKDNCLIVHIDAGEDSIQAMMRKLIEKPKPLVWNGFYTPQGGETQKETLARCYPALLSDRLKKYRRLAHVNIPITELYDTTGEETLRIIHSYLNL